METRAHFVLIGMVTIMLIASGFIFVLWLASVDIDQEFNSYDIIFARQIEALGKSGDVAFGITTSGNSKNVIEAIHKAKEQGLKTITLTGCEGGKCSGLADIDICVPSDQTPRIQESHILIYHSIAEIVENYFAQ